MRFDVEHNFGDADKWLRAIHSKVMPDAIAEALNETRDRAKGAVLTVMMRKLQSPTPFTMNAFDSAKRQNATPKNNVAWLTMKSIQASYLYSEFYGGHESELHLVPGRKIKLNQYGNLPKNATKAKGVFQMINDRRNVWKRVGRGGAGLVHVGHYTRSRSYKALIDFEGIVRQQHSNWFETEWSKAFNKAMKRGLW